MQCDNCGYIFFQPSKKCACCIAPYVPAMSAFDVGQENLFTIFEMAPGEGGIPGDMGMAGAGVEDYNFTDDFDTGEAEYGVDENVLDLSDAETEGFGISAATGAMGDDFEFDTSGMDATPSMENAGADNFDLNLSDDPADNEAVAAEPATEAGDAVDLDFEGGFDEIEGLGFGVDESPAAEAQAGNTEEISLDADSEPEISLEPELDANEEPSLELSDEPELDIDDEQPSLELSEEPSLELSEEPDLDTGEEEPSLELPEDLDLSDEPELMDASEEPELMDAAVEESTETEDEGGIDFDLDGVDLDAPEEEVTFEVPEAETGDEEAAMDFDGLELEMEAPEEPEEEGLTK